MGGIQRFQQLHQTHGVDGGAQGRLGQGDSAPRMGAQEEGLRLGTIGCYDTGTYLSSGHWKTGIVSTD